MSVLIKGMEMPTKPLIVKINPDGSVNSTYGNGYKKYEAVTVPPHGRLIDADALLNKFGKEQKAVYEHGREYSFSFLWGNELCTEWWGVERMVEDAPTIIPAEEGE